jgi:hypothetical protein
MTKVGAKKTVKVTLDAEVNDEEVWEVARRKLDGMKIHTVEDFQTELLNALRAENKTLERRLAELETAYRRTQEDNRSMRAALSVLSHQLGE